jgi:hypothetical protein
VLESRASVTCPCSGGWGGLGEQAAAGPGRHLEQKLLRAYSPVTPRVRAMSRVGHRRSGTVVMMAATLAQRPLGRRGGGVALCRGWSGCGPARREEAIKHGGSDAPGQVEFPGRAGGGGEVVADGFDGDGEAGLVRIGACIVSAAVTIMARIAW